MLICNVISIVPMGFPGNSDGKQSAHSWRELGSTLGQEDPLENGMATHSSTFAWEISWTEEPGGLHPWGCKESDMT